MAWPYGLWPYEYTPSSLYIFVYGRYTVAMTMWHAVYYDILCMYLYQNSARAGICIQYTATCLLKLHQSSKSLLSISCLWLWPVLICSVDMDDSSSTSDHEDSTTATDSDFQTSFLENIRYYYSRGISAGFVPWFTVSSTFLVGYGMRAMLWGFQLVGVLTAEQGNGVNGGDLTDRWRWTHRHSRRGDQLLKRRLSGNHLMWWTSPAPLLRVYLMMSKYVKN